MGLRLPSLESLRVLESCVRNGSFTRAATELGITPSAVSLRIRNLEGDLDIVLFNRSGPTVMPTGAAVAMAARLSDGLALFRSAVDLNSNASRPLRVSVPPSLGSRWLAPRLANYQAPSGAVPIQLDVSAEVRSSERFDLAIRTGHGGWQDVIAIKLMSVDVTPMLSPALVGGSVIDQPEQLAVLPLLPHDDWRRWFAEGGTQVQELQFTATQYPTHELDAAAAIDGVGVALLSPLLFAPLLADGVLVRPFSRAIVGPAWHYLLMHPNERRESVLHLADWLKEQLGYLGT